MTPPQKVFAVFTCIFIFILIIYLVKRGKLREEYSWMWLLTGLVLLVLVLRYDVLVFFTRLIGAVLPTTTLFIFGIVFLLLLSLHFAIKLSMLSNQVKNITQLISILEAQNDPPAQKQSAQMDRS